MKLSIKDILNKKPGLDTQRPETYRIDVNDSINFLFTAKSYFNGKDDGGDANKVNISLIDLLGGDLIIRLTFLIYGIKDINTLTEDEWKSIIDDLDNVAVVVKTTIDIRYPYNYDPLGMIKYTIIDDNYKRYVVGSSIENDHVFIDFDTDLFEVLL